MSKTLDGLINFLKWPVALYMFISIPGLINSFHFFDISNMKNISLLCGLVFFIFSKTMMDQSVRTSMQVIAHEFAHTFFTLLTFHKVKHIRLHPDDTGGEMGFLGKGNWLIVIAPYFFPLFCFIYMVIMFFLPDQFIYNAVLGYFLGYHIDTVASQIHPEQTDLPKVGYGFCVLFLPGINLLMIGLILAFNTKSLEGIVNYFKLFNQLNLEYFIKLSELLRGLFQF